MAGDQNATLEPELRRVAGLASRLGRWSPLLAVSRIQRSIRRGALDLLYPDVCLNCGAGVVPAEPAKCSVPFCAQCLDSFELFAGPTCARCGAPPPASGPVLSPKRGGCFHCAGRKLWFDRAIAAGEYTGHLRESLLRMKHAQNEALSLAMGRLILDRCCKQLGALDADVVVPVPMHWRRRLARGTNSAAVLAEVLARQLSAPLAERLLRRLRHTPPQFSLSPPQRWENVRRVFAVRRGYYLTDAHVVLVDDILTTGATGSEAARTLRKAGASRVTVVVAARALSH